MTPRTVTAAPTDKSMWWRLLRVVHPDHGGEQDLFIWVDALRSYVIGDQIEDVRTYAERRAPPQRAPSPDTGDRIDFTAAYEVAESFDALTARVVSMPAVAYRVGMGRHERVRWYRIAESVPLSQRHVGHILSKL